MSSELIFGKYEVIRRIALGGMGEVFLARQTGVAGFDRLVILKSLLPELAEQDGFIDQFLDEARVAATLNHPNIVAIYEVGLWNGVYFIAMEFIHGCDLSKLQKSAARSKVVLPFQVSARIIMDACVGLHHAHTATDTTGAPLHIVHRDISPQNIMVRGDGVTKVVDFGVAMASNRSTRTATGVLKGKLQYMPPEQLQGETLDGRSDQFALGVVLWEMCTGQRLFKADNELKVLEKILKEQVPLPSAIIPGFPPDLEATIMRMLARDREKRFPTCAEAAAALNDYLSSSSRLVGEQQVADFVKKALGDELEKVTSDLTPASGNFMLSLGDRSGADLGTTPATSQTTIQRHQKKSRIALAAGLGVGALLILLAVIAVLLSDRERAAAEMAALSDTGTSIGQSASPQRASSHKPLVRQRRGRQGKTVLDIPEPVGAVVYVDGQRWKEKVPTTITGLAGGSHEIVLEVNGERQVAEQVVVEKTPPVLRLTTTPPGAAVKIGGTMVGVTPFEIATLQPGDYDLEVSLRGYRSERVKVALQGGLVERALTLRKRRARSSSPAPKPAPPPKVKTVVQVEKEQFGFITIKTIPWAKISLDGEPIGSTPIFKRRVSAGKHTVRFVNEEEDVNTVRHFKVKPGKVFKKIWHLK